MVPEINFSFLISTLILIRQTSGQTYDAVTFLACPSSWTLQDQYCFYKSSLPPLISSTTWTNAETGCTNLLPNSHLAYFFNNAAWTSFQTFRSSASLTNVQLWIGCKKSSGAYRWPNGTAVGWSPSGTEPLPPSAYCMSDSDGLNTWISDPGMQSIQYICMAMATAPIIASEIFIYQSATSVSTGGVVKFWGSSFTGQDATTVYQWDFGDGSKSNTTGYNFNTSHSYTSASIATPYTVTVNVSNAVSGPVSASNTSKVTVGSPCVIDSCTVNSAVATGTPTEFTIVLSKGSNCDLNIDPKDGKSVVEIGVGSFDVQACNSTTPGCGQLVAHWTKTFNYTYTNASTYNAIANATNSYGSVVKACGAAVVQDTIAGLVVTSPANLYYAYNVPVVVAFAVTKGSAINFTATIDGTNLSSMTWNSTNNSGTFTVMAKDMISVGLKMVTIEATNLVTPTVTVLYSFTVEYPFKQLQYTPVNGYINTTNTAFFMLSWSNATVVNCVVDFPGTTAPTTYNGIGINKVIVNYNDTVPTAIPKYSAPGNYIIQVNCSNHISFVNYTILVIAQDPICCLKLSIDYVGSLATATGSTAPVNLSLIWTDLTQPWPTNAKYDYNFIASPAKIGNTFLNQTPQSINYNYSVSDTYVINITVYNLVSTVTFIRAIDIVVRFGNVTFDMTKLQPMSGNEPTKYYLQTSEVAQFTINLTQGTLFTYTINFRDGNTYTNSSKFAKQINYLYAYTKAGQYNVTLLIQNAANNITLLLPYPAPYQYLFVEQSVECFDFTILEGLEPVIKYVSRMNGTTIHVNVTSNSSCGGLTSLPRYSISWGDSTTSIGNMTDEFVIVPHNYNSSQVFNLNFTIWNEVSTLTASQSIYVYEEVTKVNITVVWVNNTALLPGYHLTSSKGYYPLGYVMHIYAGMIYGNLESYTWKINGNIQPETNKTLIRNFTAVGTYVFFVEIKNTPSGGNSTFTVIIENPTINLNFTDNSPWPLTVEPYHQYSVSMDGVGTDSCYFFDMDDDLPPKLGQNPDCQYLFFGNMQTCSELISQYNSIKTIANCPLKTSLSSAILEAPADLSVDPNDTSTSSLFYGKLNGKSFINFTHQFGNRGAHNVTFIVANHVFKSTIYYRSVVTKGWCSFAAVIVNDLNKCQTMENCKCYFRPDGSCTANDVPNGNRVSYFKDQLLIDADVTMNCSSSPDIWFRWTVKLLDLSAKGDIIGNATQFLNGIPYQTFYSKTLVIPAHAMPAGRYLFNLTVSPNDEIDMDRSDTTIVVVEASPIVAQFAGGAAGMHVPQTQQYLFDAWTNSYDPDVDPTNKTGLQFSFYCRRLCETWPPPLPGQTYSSWGGSLDSGCSAATDGTKKGCFGSGPGPLIGSTPNWAVKSGNVTLNTAAMAANVWYSLMVVVSKADTLNPQAARISYAEMFFFVSTANVPNIRFNCVTNCQQGYSKLTIPGSSYQSGRSFNRVNPTSRFSAEAIIPGFDMATTYLYSWDLIQRSNDCQANSFSMAKLTPVPDLQWLPNATTGRSIRTLSLRSNWYGNDTSSKPGFYIRLSFWINSNTTGPTGQYFYEFFLNDPPPTSGTSVGSCKINQEGVSLSSTFGFVCTNFLDSNNGDMYFYVKQIDQTSYDFWLDIGSNKKSAMKDDTIYVKAVPGPENATKEYETNFKIVVFDSSGSYIDVFVNASITPFDINSTYRENAVWSILDYTSTCSMCQIEDFYLQLTKLQRCVDVSAVVRTFSTMLNLNPSTGCQPLVCNNKTAESHNCTIGEEIEVTTMAPVPIPPDIQIQINNSLGPKWKYLGQCQLDLQMRIYLRERLLGAFSTLKIPYFSSFALMLSALYPATVVAQENTIQIMQDVEAIIREGVSHLDGVDPFMTLTLEADTREEICTIITGIVANMERTTNYYGQIWRDSLLKYYPQFTMDGLQTEVATLDSMITNNISVDYTTFKFNETNPIWTLVNVNDTLDTATSNELAVIRFNITLISVVLNRIYKLKNNVTNYIQARKAMGEAPSILTTTNITAVYHKTPVKNMTNFPMQGLGACQFHAANAAEMFGDLNTLEESVMGSIECATNNPFTTDITSEGLFGTVSMKFQNSNGNIDVANLTKPMDIFLPRTIDRTVLKPLWNTTDTFSSPMVVYSFSLPQYSGLTIVFHTGWIDMLDNTNATIQNVSEAEPTTTETTAKQATTVNGSDTDPVDIHEPGGSGYEERFVIFFKFWNTFDLENKYDTYCTIPRFDESLYNSTANPNYGDPKSCTVSWNQALAAAKDGDNVLTKSINVFVAVQSFPRGYTMSDFKNTTKISNFNENYFVPVNYTLFAIYSSCMYYDSTRRIWRGDGTDIGPNTTTEVTHCLATHLTSFSTSMNVPMNSLNLQDSAFLHLAENPIAFVFCMCLFCLYIILFVWCRRKDKEDLKKTGIAPLPDNDPRDKYLYQIVFYTASRPNAGTSANIFFQLTGEYTESDVRLAKDSQRLAFRRNGIDTFIMAVPTSLGTLTHLRIWHDNTGDNPSWYLSRLQIMDVQTGEQFFFVVDNWLAVEEGDGHVERIVPVAGKKDLTDFNQLFWQKTQKNLFDGHIWFSVFRRPPRSHFTRVQRLTCCLSLIYCTMVANILFYQVKPAQFDDIILSIGPITVTWTSLKTGIIAALIVAPINTLLVLLFRYARPIPIKSPMDEYLENRKKLEKLEQRKTSKHNLIDSMVDEGSTDKLTENIVTNESAASLALNSSKIHDNDHSAKHPSNKESELEMVEQHPNTKTKADHVAIELEPPRVVHIDTRAKKKRFWLPHWVIYIGYVLAFVTVGVAFWLIMQIAFGFGKKKALDWVLAMFISLIQSIIFIQPVKIIAMAIVYAVFCKSPEKDEYEPTEIDLKEDEVYVHEDMATINDMKNKTKRQAIIEKLKRTRNALPPELQMLQNAREIRLKEIAMWSLIREMIFYAVFLYTLMMVAYGERNFLTFQMIKNGHDIFILGAAYRRNGNITDFNSIETQADFFNWAEQILLPGLFPNVLYNTPIGSDQRYIDDGQGYLTGTLRFRQLRVKPNTCKVPNHLQHSIFHCRSSYSISTEDWGQYKKNWIPLDTNNTDDAADDLFSWKNMSTLKEKPFVGVVATYWGGGYVADLESDGVTASNVLNELKSFNWLDAHTRAVFVEFSVYYPASNMIMISKLLIEYLSTGGAVVSPNLQGFCLDVYSGTNAVPIILAEVSCLLFLIYFIYKEITKLIKEKKRYFLSFWNWLELLVISLLITALITYVIRVNSQTSAETAYKAKPNQFANFSSPLFYSQLYSWMLYIVLFIANVKFLRLLRFNRRIAVFIETMRYGWKYMMAFFCTFILVFMAFSSSAFIFFGTEILGFMNFTSTIESLLVVMLNVFSWNEFSQFNRIFGPLFFIIYTLILNFILVNMFLSVVNDSFAVVKSESLEQTNEYELIDFIWNKFIKLFGFGNQVENGGGQPTYAEVQDVVERDLNDCHDKLELLCDRMQDYFTDEHIEEKMKLDWRFKDAHLDLDGHIKKHPIISE